MLENTYQEGIINPKSILNVNAESMNANKLEQDHPCVIEIIRSKFMSPPAARNEPYQLDDIEKLRALDERPMLDTLSNHLLKKKVTIANSYFQ